MKFLNQTILIFFLLGVATSMVFAHGGTHDMTFLEEVVHFISSSFHLGPVIGVILALLVLRIYRKWISYYSNLIGSEY